MAAIADELGHPPSAAEMNAHDGFPSAPTYQSRFGSWNEALAAAGLGVNEVSAHDPAALRAALAWLTRELGRVPSARDMDEAGRFSASAYWTHFGSWEAALAELGLSSPSRCPRLSDRQLITDLQVFANYGGVGRTHSPSKRAMDANGPHSYNLYADRFGSWSAALVAAGLDPRQRITHDEIIAAIHELAERVGGTPGGPAPMVADLADHGDLSLHVIVQEFDSWNEAVSAAGFQPNEGRPSYTTDIADSELLAELRRVAALLDGSPTSEEFAEHGQYGPTTYERRYGSWHRALTLAGLCPQRENPGGWARGTSTTPSSTHSLGSSSGSRLDHLTITAADVPYVVHVGDILVDWWSPLRTFVVRSIEADVEALRPVHRVITQPTTLDEPYTRALYSDMLRERFAEQTMAIRTSADGLPRPVRPRKTSTLDASQRVLPDDATLLADLRRLADECERSPTQALMQEQGRFSVTVYQDRFGSWNDALRAAGLEVNIESPDDATLLAELRRLADESGRSPTQTLMREQGRFSVTVYQDRFGSWNDSLREAGLDINMEMSDSPGEDALRAELQRLASDIGEPPSIPEMKRHGQYSSTSYITAFGSWNDALRAAGLEVNMESPAERPISRSEAITAIQRVGDAVEGTPTAAQMDDLGTVSVTACLRQFDSWNEAVRAAGFEPHRSTE